MCAHTLGVTSDKPNIEIAHRIARYQVNKNRPIVVKVCPLKDKEAILSSGNKIKGTEFAMREDVSVPIRHARRKLLEFAKKHEAPYKLKYDKRLLGGSLHIYDAATDAAVQSKR